MKTTQLILTALLGATLLNAIAAHAEDIDIYSGLSGAAGLPNVLIVLDTAAGFNAAAAVECRYADDFSSPSITNKLAGIEQCALYNTIDSLPTNEDGTASVNVGFMIYNTLTSDALGSGCTSSNEGACLVKPLAAMTDANKTALKTWIKGWTIAAIGSNDQGNALAMQEAWAYYAGNTGASGRTYTQPDAGCQKNFVIFLGNAYGASGSPGDSGSPSSMLSAAPAIADVTTTPNPDTTKIVMPTGSYGSCGTFTWNSVNHTDLSGYYADEWTRYMYQTDIYGSKEGIQNIVTYTVGALGASCDAKYAALLTSMAKYGGGKYFATDASDGSITNAILSILNEVQAVNSVFASSSLPVSVNAQGTYLNQIYMGMFRPDSSGLPRWVGNLKQYQFGYDQTSQTLSLVDSLGESAISGAGTGFISPNAVSFWTSKNTGVEPDSGGGFWRNLPQGAGAGYDSPDGELVEKGGAAQVMRKAFLWNDYSVNKTSPRNVYTYLGDPQLSAVTNAFATSNGNINAGMFGTRSYVNISGITRSVIGGVSTATVTTSGNHGFSTGDAITITGATPTAYNGTFAITYTGSRTFTFPVVEYPPTPATGLYQASLHDIAAVAVSSLSRSVNNVPANAQNTQNIETVTVTTAAAHGFVTGDRIDISGATPGNYNGTYTITRIDANTFTYPITITPPTPATGSYAVALSSVIAKTHYAYSCSKVAGQWNATLWTTTPHDFVTNDLITIAGMNANLNGTWNIKSVGSTTSYTFIIAANCTGTVYAGSVTPAATQKTISPLTRTGTATSASSPYPDTATATIATSNMYATGDVVKIVTLSAGTNETPYTDTGPYTITCASTACTTFTYKINAAPATPASGTITAAHNVIVAQNIDSLTRTYPGGTTVTATLVGGSAGFATGDQVDISQQPDTTLPANEGVYVATWIITCIGASPCTEFTYGPITLTPGNATVGGTASKDVAPNKDPLINWLRGEDNFGDEPSPDSSYAAINIRPSLHGDVLHSRPTVINYGGDIGVVVFYGANDGVYRAVNGNQTAAIGSVSAGSELWSFIPTEFFGRIQRMHDNSPILDLFTTPDGIVPPPQKKDYFVDGSTSIYQKMNADGTTDKAYLYLAMRRGGQFIYALDVSDPTEPRFMWKRDNSSAGFDELGQTWSQPKVAFVKGHTNPVLIFGAGYDTAQDSEPPAADGMGRGIFIVDAFNGDLVWKATYGAASSCDGLTPATCTVAGMNYSIPADITLMDRSGNDGYTDRLYAVDMGGNIWRVDLQPNAGITPDKWQVTQLAALGCDTGACASGTTPRKFFYPADMLHTTDYDAVLIGSGDREHPLRAHQSYNDVNRFYMVKDLHTGNDATTVTVPPQTLVTEKTGATANLKDITPAGVCATTAAYDNTLNGYYFTLCAGEKVVNAPLTAGGYTYFGTNTPATPSDNSCSTNLGIAKGYRIEPLTGISSSVIYDGGGLPPSAVAGAVGIDIDGDGNAEVLPFCIGCGGGGNAGGQSALSGEKLIFNIPTRRNRTYWYIEGK